MPDRIELAQVAAEVEKLRAFKSLVHQTLDEMGVPKCEGVDCRVGARLDYLRTKLAAIEWQPIETAPKDGTEILTWGGKFPMQRFYIAHYAEGGGEDQPRFGPGWFYLSSHHFYSECHPTHWMLPKPPLQV
jgi:hypothetical protein